MKVLLTLGMVDELRAADCFGLTPLNIAAHHKAYDVLTVLAETESFLERTKQLTKSSPVGCGYSSAEMDFSFGRSLLAPVQSRYETLPVRPRQVRHGIDRGWKNLLPNVQRQQCLLRDVIAILVIILGLAILIAIWTLVARLFR